MNNVNKLKFNEPGYPKLLVEIATPPPQLFWSGRPIDEWLSKPKVAIVGSRKITPYGRLVTSKLAAELARVGVVVISGLAYGVDITAHQAALSAGGITVAVLPTGLDQIYPSAHVHIAEQIRQNGTLITEYKTGMEGFKSNFIARNRIVSGLSDVLLITEAALKSGSLHTARFALEQGKTVMAVPGNINSPISEGCNNLIKSGAVPVTSADDVLFALKLNPADKSQRAINASPQEKLVFGLIQQGLKDQEELAVAAQLESPALASALTMLELSGYIRPEGAGKWAAA